MCGVMSDRQVAVVCELRASIIPGRLAKFVALAKQDNTHREEQDRCLQAPRELKDTSLLVKLTGALEACLSSLLPGGDSSALQSGELIISLLFPGMGSSLSHKSPGV